MTNLVEIFKQEVDVNLQEATRLALELEKQGHRRELIEGLMRVFHTLKGAARAVQFDEERTVAHRMEDGFHAVLHGKCEYADSLVDLTLFVIDLFNELLTSRLNESQMPSVELLDDLVDAFLQGKDFTLPDAAAGIAEASTSGAEVSEPSESFLPDGLDFNAIFKVQAEGHLAECRQHLDILKDNPADAQAQKNLRRIFHTLKGAARAISFDEIRDIAALAEKTVHAVERLDEPVSEGFLKAADCCRLWLESALDVRLQGGQLEIQQELLDAVANYDAADWHCPQAPLMNTAAAVEEVDFSPEPAAASAETESKNKPSPVIKKRLRETASVPYEQIDKLQNIGGELTVATAGFVEQRSRLRRMSTKLGGVMQHLSRLSASTRHDFISQQRLLESLGGIFDELDQLSGDLDSLTEHQDNTEVRFQQLVDSLNSEITLTRLEPLATLFDDYERIVRDLAKTLGKQVNLQISGASNRIDRAILESIRNPLLQLVRNAMDHGFESTAQRSRSAKPATGQLWIKALQVGSVVRITVADDGAGINLQKLGEKVVSQGHTTFDLWQSMTEVEKLDFLFLPGFSTASKVSETSGRGFGLDIVKSNVEAVGGRVLIENHPGAGCHFIIEVPLSLSLTRCLLVVAGNDALFGDQLCAFPVNEIEAVMRLNNSQLRDIDGQMAANIEGETILLHDLHTILGLNASHNLLQNKHLLLLRHADIRYGLLVDNVVDELDLVIRGMDPRLGKVQELSGLTMLNDGRLAMLMDVSDLLQRMAEGSLQVINAAEMTEQAAETSAHVSSILIVEDSATVREVEKHFLQQAGYEVSTAVNGMDGLNKAKAGNFDLIISDIDMPRMNGIEMISQIRDIQRLQAVPIIVVSYKDRQEDQDAAMNAGANDYVTKSEFDTENMLELIAALLSQQELS